jgi:hypothetical protein
MMSNHSQVVISQDVQIMATSGRGFSPEEVAERALNKIIYVAEDANPVIKEQAQAYRDHIRQVLVFYMKEAIKSDRTTLANILTNAGHPELVKLLEI